MKMFNIIALFAILAAPAFAADGEKADTTTVDHSKNPITGTHTTKVKRHHKNKAHGHGDESTTTETTKVEKDGDVKKEVKTSSDATAH